MESLSGQTCVGGMDVGGRDMGRPIPCGANTRSRNMPMTSSPKVQDDNRGKIGSHPARVI